MSDASFIAYVGDPDFHDGSIVAVEHEERVSRVRVCGASGKAFLVVFTGVYAVRANAPEGMVLYALSELRGEPPMRRFVFANWDSDGKGFLEIVAETVTVLEDFCSKPATQT